MLAFFVQLEHTLSNNGIDIASVLSIIDKVVGIVTTLIAGVCAIKGITYINRLREKTDMATFTYWTQLCTRLISFESRLKNNNGLINNMFSPESRTAWGGSGISAKEIEVKEFFDLAVEIQSFMKETLDQMPAYPGWVDDYYYLVNFIDNVIRCDIKNPNDNFLFSEKKTISDRNEFCLNACERMRRMIEQTQKKQKKAEIEIYKNRNAR